MRKCRRHYCAPYYRIGLVTSLCVPVLQVVRKEMKENDSAEQEIQEAVELERFLVDGHIVRRVWDTDKACEVFVMFGVLLACDTMTAQKRN